jgi:hypothetical protein
MCFQRSNFFDFAESPRFCRLTFLTLDPILPQNRTGLFMSKPNVIMKDTAIVLAARLISSFAAFAVTLATQILGEVYCFSLFVSGMVDFTELRKLRPASLKLQGV